MQQRLQCPVAPQAFKHLAFDAIDIRNGRKHERVALLQLTRGEAQGAHCSEDQPLLPAGYLAVHDLPDLLGCQLCRNHIGRIVEQRLLVDGRQRFFAQPRLL